MSFELGSSPTHPGFNQCRGKRDVQPIPIMRSIPTSESAILFSEKVVIDTNLQDGGCIQGFRVTGSSTFVLDMVLFADDEGVGQCTPHNGSIHNFLTASDGKGFVNFVLATDGRFGGCVQQLRLRRVG